MTTLSFAAAGATHLSGTPQSLLDNPLNSTLVTVTLIVTGFLFILNATFAIIFRKRRAIELLSYIGAAVIQLAIFAFLLALRVGILTHVPFNLPPGLPVNSAELGSTVALAIGLFPAAYWHRVSMSQLRQRMAEDAKVIKNREGGVRIRSNAPGEWLN
ncbi:MAG TPA: hypothetical protein VFN35_22475 [Ktedonobacteraceae bacterium]|nr:hypothetical protein [Ktedonobacteraceae bacterium]